jgi:hypothetical protein
MATKSERKAALWELWVGVLVGLGMAATIGYAFVETFWG